MKTVQKDNRVETINDTDLADAMKRGWREINPDTGEPIAVNAPARSLAALEAENAELRRNAKSLSDALFTARARIIELDGVNASLKDAMAAKGTSGEPPKGKTKGKAAEKPPEGDESRTDTADEGKAAE